MKKKSPSYVYTKDGFPIPMNRAARISRRRPILVPIRRVGVDEQGRTLYTRGNQPYVPAYAGDLKKKG